MASDRKAALSLIKQHIKDGLFQDALLQCKELLRTNPDSFEGNVYAGKCACELNQYEEAERYYKSAHDHKPTALQPYHGLVQLYRRTGAHDKHADALRHVLANTTDKSVKYGTRIELAKALIQSNRLDEASVAIIAIEDDLHEGCVNEDAFEVPEEVSMLKADCQLALDEQEYNSRIENALATRRYIMSNNGEDKRDDDLLIQEVAATWAEEMLNRPNDAVSRMAQAASSTPHPRFTKYQIEMLKRVMATIQGEPAGSAERHDRRVAAVQMCYDIVSRGGCTNTTPYELALRLLEVEEEVSACAAGTGAGVSFSLPAGASKGIAGMGGASAAGGSVSRSISIQQAAANAVAAVSGGATAPLVASTDTHPQPHSQPPLPPPAPPTAVPVPQQQTLEASRLQLTPVATVPPLAHMSSATSQTMPSSATAAAAAPGASNLDLLLSGMPLASVGGSQADGDASTLPHTPARRSSSGVTPSGSRSGPPGRKGGPSFGPTNIDLDDIETPPSSEVPSEGGAPEDAKTEAPADDTTHVGDAGMHGPSDAVTMPNSRMLVNALRGSMVRFAVRQTSEFAEPEVIPVMGSYELRSLSRMHEGAASAALASATGAATAAGAVSGSIVPATTATDVPVADVQPRGAYTGESPLRADCQSSVGPGGSAAGLGGHVLGCIPRRNSYASSDAFGGHLSLGSVAGSDELAPPRTALPPLSALPRISREGTAASGTFTGHLPAAGGGSFAAGGAASFAAGRSPSRVVSMSHAPSLTSRVSESAQGSFFAGNRYVPPADEEVAAVRQVGLLEDMERFAARLVHLAPTSDVGQAHLAMALQRRAAELEQATPQLQRPRVIAALRQPLARGAPTAAGWLCLAGLYRKDGNHSEALWAARMGLQYISGRVRASGERMTQAGLALRLEAAQALLALERLDEAVDAFSLLKEWTSEGEITFPYVAGIMPTSVRQQAARGLAQVEVRKGNRHAAKKQYEKLLGKALRGFGPSEHWAHAEYAWLLYEDGLREQALHHLQAAIDVSGLGDTAVDPAEVASYHHKLGRVLWETKAKGEEGAKDAANAYEAFLHAASVDGPAQAPAFACLGHYFREKGEEMKARKCYQRALELDCLQAGAGLALCELLHESNSEDIVKGICKEMLEVEPEAVWARLRLGLHHLWLARPQEAISELQAALRMEPANAEAWEALGAAYESVGRLQAALKVYERAVELDDRRVFALTQAAAISSLTGNTDGALALLDRALAVEPGNPAVLMCQCQTHSQIAALYKSLGALTLASGSLRKAAGAAAQSARINGTLETTWKSLGDCRIAQARLPTPSQPPLQNILEASTGSSSEAAETNTRALIEAYGERKGVARSAQRAYAAAVHLNPLRPASWSDLALTQHQRVTLSAAHSAVRDTPVDTEALCGTAERVLMAALRLAPDVPGLWSALGSVETAPAKREYALRRALQLDPSDALTWLKLGRLYHAHSMQGKATACFDAARSCDPKLPAIWEAMAATEATHDPYATPCSTTATQVFGLSKHALQLRGGPEAALGFLWSALRDAEVSTWGTTRAAAHCATSAQPLNAAAYHALGLVMESSSAFSKAACVLRTALVLLKRNAEAASDGADMAETEALMKLSGRAKGAGPALIAPVKSMSVQRCLELDLARVLAKSGNYQESVQLYTNLLESSGSDSVAESTGMDAYALLAFARASAGAKHSSATGKVASDADSDGMFEPGLLKKAAAVADTLPATADVAAASVATVALSQTAPYAQVRAHAQTVDVTISQAEEGVLRAPPSTQAAVHRAVLQARLSVLTAATLRATDSDFFQAESTCRHSLLRMRMHITPSDDVPSGAATMHAEAVADTHVACAARAVRYAQFARARCAAARAVHVCPWSAVHRDVAACIAASNAKQPQHASRITAQHAAGALQQLESTLMHGGAAATAHLVGGVAGLPPAGGVTVPTRGALASAIKSARVRVLQCPRDPHAWTSLAHLLTQQAALSRTADDARSAECACMQSLHVTRTDPSPDRSNEVLAAHALVLKSVAQSVAAEGCEIAGVNASMNESAQCEAGTPEPRASTSHSRLGAPSAAACSPASPARSPPFTRGVTRVGVSGGKNASTAAAGSSTSPVDTAQIALRTAQQALQAIEGLGAVEGSEKSHMHALKGASLRQLARCHRLVGDTNAMVATLQHGKQLGDPCSSILLAKQLWSCGESSEASGMLSEASRTLADSPASVACAEWLGAVHVSQVELACMAGDLKVATSGLQACAAAGSRPAGVATALVATAACMHGSASLKHHGMSPQAQQQLSQANDLAVKSFEACDGADVITVGASAIAEISDLLGNSQSAKLAHEAADSGYQHLKDGKRRHPAYMHIERDTGQESETGGLPKVALGVTSPSPLGKGQGLEDAGMKNLSCVVVRLAGSKAAES